MAGTITLVRRRVQEGIRLDQYGYEAHVKVGGKQVAKRFPKKTHLDEIQRWRDVMRRSLNAERVFVSKRPKIAELKKSLKGWCYVYFVRSGNVVKIGTTEEPAARFRTLQTSHPSPLEMLAAVPAHAALEQAIHARFASLRQTGEWFALDDNLIAFINAVAQGVNPVALLW